MKRALPVMFLALVLLVGFVSAEETKTMMGEFVPGDPIQQTSIRFRLRIEQHTGTAGRDGRVQHAARPRRAGRLPIGVGNGNPVRRTHRPAFKLFSNLLPFDNPIGSVAHSGQPQFHVVESRRQCGR